MKTIRLVTTILFCILCVNISHAQTVKKQQSNKQDAVKGVGFIPHVRNSNLSQVEKDHSPKYSNQKKDIKERQILSKSNKNSLKINAVNPTNIEPNPNRAKSSESTKKNILKHKLDYRQQQLKNKESKDE